ncbi:DUF1653 domain-containing protein [Candidatus Gracilibacteria bacterium]|nr:DUF1653 domain-containing protein [Candidatus Gracilibacteria bacterium]NJS41450.1 DUF1653 domain-containing protein [Candidatus Gracilibacteria bacterium]
MQLKPQTGDIYYHFKHFTENPQNEADFMVYEIVGIAGNATDNQYNPLVIYKPIKDTSYLEKKKIDFYSRPLEEFLESVSRDNYEGPRFCKITPKG